MCTSTNATLPEDGGPIAGKPGHSRRHSGDLALDSSCPPEWVVGVSTRQRCTLKNETRPEAASAGRAMKLPQTGQPSAVHFGSPPNPRKLGPAPG
jgi:hypothetical protein